MIDSIQNFLNNINFCLACDLLAGIALPPRQSSWNFLEICITLWHVNIFTLYTCIKFHMRAYTKCTHTGYRKSERIKRVNIHIYENKQKKNKNCVKRQCAPDFCVMQIARVYIQLISQRESKATPVGQFMIFSALERIGYHIYDI